MRACVIFAGTTCFYGYTNLSFTFYFNVFKCSGTSSTRYGVRLSNGAIGSMYGCRLEGSGGTSRGLYAGGGCIVSGANTSGYPTNHLDSWGTAATIFNGSSATTVANYVYTNNTTDYSFTLVGLTGVDTDYLNVLADLDVAGNAVIDGTLGVTGAATLSSTLGVTGNTTLGGYLTLGARSLRGVFRKACNDNTATDLFEFRAGQQTGQNGGGASLLVTLAVFDNAVAANAGMAVATATRIVQYRISGAASSAASVITVTDAAQLTSSAATVTITVPITVTATVTGAAGYYGVKVTVQIDHTGTQASNLVVLASVEALWEGFAAAGVTPYLVAL
jgi:hypothetical protein